MVDQGPVAAVPAAERVGLTVPQEIQWDMGDLAFHPEKRSCVKKKGVGKALRSTSVLWGADSPGALWKKRGQGSGRGYIPRGLGK